MVKTILKIITIIEIRIKEIINKMQIKQILNKINQIIISNKKYKKQDIIKIKEKVL